MSGTRRGGETAEERAARKAAVKADKAHRRAAREGRLASVDPDYGKKACDLCGTLVDLLIRCQTDESGRWFMVCGGKCWKEVSGGVVDGDAQHPYYRYVFHQVTATHFSHVAQVWRPLEKSACQQINF